MLTCTEQVSFLSEEQIAASVKNKSSKHFWCNEAAKKGFKLHFALSKFGYSFLLKTDYPAPSYSNWTGEFKVFQLTLGSDGSASLVKDKDGLHGCKWKILCHFH